MLHHLRLSPTLLVAAVVWLCLGVRGSAQDVLELLSGAKVEGKITNIDKDKKLITFSANIGGRSFERVYPYGKVHAVTYQGKRRVLTEKTETPPPTATPRPGGGKTTEPRPTDSRPPANVKQIIEQAGRTPVDWLDSTPLDYPPSLDLAWPAKPPPGWNNQVNIGQYLWDIINPNPGRWKSGVRFIHHMLETRKNDADVRRRALSTLGGMYFNLFQDYARAAYYWQEAGEGSVALAECYFRLGDRKAAEAFLTDPDRPRQNSQTSVNMIKLWGDMGETNKAVKLAELYVRSGGQPGDAYLVAGDACRVAGRYREALQLYQKVLDAPPSQNQGRDKMLKERATANQEAIKRFELLDVSRVKDGKYRASSRGYSGPLEVEVTVAGGRIEAVRVTQHTEKQFYSALTDVPNQIITKQGLKGVDATSRATLTGEAIINATGKALAQ